MNLIAEVVFWACIFIVFYAYLGYGMVLYGIVKLKRIFKGKFSIDDLTDYHEVTHLIAAYNEEDFIAEKIENSLSVDYPKDKMKVMVVTDGSNDSTAEIVSGYTDVTSFHKDERKGKIHAVNRVMEHVKTPIIIFSDANTLLNEDAIKNIVRHYDNPKVGGVAGEKRILKKTKDNAAGAGEGLYWRYESFLKKLDSELYSVVGAAGELFSLRTELYEPVKADTIIEDFYLTLNIASKGYIIRYEPDAYATETSSESVGEEFKRKVRIAAGGFQSIVRLRKLLNIFKYGWLSFQYTSHRVLRWTLAPLALLLALLTNAWLAIDNWFYMALLVLQILFYILGLIGYRLQKRDIKVKVLFVPFYFSMMNWAVYLGFRKYLLGNQSVVWEKAKRAKA
ncbi:MAG: glycosyltransferase family 2 protein [Bacteroidota bacterium]